MDNLKINIELNGKTISTNESYAKGGDITGVEEVWNGWSVKQREHFLSDHRILSNKAEDKRVSLYRLDELPIDLLTVIKSKLKEHIDRGSYAKGGSLTKNEKEGLRWGKIKDNDEYWSDYSDIGQFSISRSNWSMFTDEDFYEKGKEIVKKEYNGDIEKAYITIVRGGDDSTPTQPSEKVWKQKDKDRNFRNGGQLSMKI